MIHYSTERHPLEDHYAVGHSTSEFLVLIQIQQEGVQSRIPLSATEARHLANLLINAANKVSE